MSAKQFSNHKNIIDTIESAGQSRKTVIITYRDGSGAITSRETEPYEIKGDKYFGYCLNKNGIRGFLLSNISSAVTTNNTYNPRWNVKF